MKHIFISASWYLEMIISLDWIPRKEKLSQKICMFKILIDTSTVQTSCTSVHVIIMYKSPISPFQQRIVPLVYIWISYEQLWISVTNKCSKAKRNVSFTSRSVLTVACEQTEVLLFDPISSKHIKTLSEAHEDCVNNIRLVLQWKSELY